MPILYPPPPPYFSATDSPNGLIQMMDLKDIKEFPGRPGCSPPGSPSILRHPGDVLGGGGGGGHAGGMSPHPAGGHPGHHGMPHHRLLAQSKESLMGKFGGEGVYPRDLVVSY